MQDINFDTLNSAFVTVPWMMVGLLAGFLAASMLLLAPTVYVRNVGTVRGEELSAEHRTVWFFGFLFAAGVLLAATWMCFTQASNILGNIL